MTASALTFLTLILSVSTLSLALTFKDITAQAGLSQKLDTFKWGGPCVADLDGDGFYDLIFSYHFFRRPQVFFGSANGTFTLANLTTIIQDVHGITVAIPTAFSSDRLLTISVGGARGETLRAPEYYSVSKNRTFRYVTDELGLTDGIGRGRNIVFMKLGMQTVEEQRRNGGGPDILSANYLGDSNSPLTQYAFQNDFGKFKSRAIAGYEREFRGRVEVTDVEGDGIMEVISIRHMNIYQLVAPFHFVRANNEYFPWRTKFGPMASTSVAELDFDNDGRFDLYVARADRTLVSNWRVPLSADFSNDILLHNRGGRFKDASFKAELPLHTDSVGVTAGDFNNDGYVDLLVSLLHEPPMILLNRGDGRFKRVDGLIPKSSETVGDHAVAVDIDQDGRLDVIVGQGSKEDARGKYMLMKNTMPLTDLTRYLLVTVRNEPLRAATALHAVVYVSVDGSVLSRRVGSRGAQAGGGSFLDMVHFGLGSWKVVDSVRVIWTTGYVEEKLNVTTNRKLTFGVE